MSALPPADLPEPPEFPSPTIVDSRRLMGPNLYSAHEGALLEVRVANDQAALLRGLLDSWAAQVHTAHRALDWPTPAVIVRERGAEAFAFATAPVDGLMTATTVNELAWVAAEATDLGTIASVDLAALRVLAEQERATHPHVAEVHAAAVASRVIVTFDDELLSVGSGTGGQSWPLLRVPRARDISWADVHDVPVALVTGSNGKTTTTRLVAAMWRASGRVTGWCCSDGVWVNDAQLESGDYSGPAGARVVLRDARVQAAVLETARGGMLRRGLAVHRAHAAIITNIAADHFGEYGVHTLADLTEAKGIVTRALGDGATLVLNADDAQLVAYAAQLSVRCAWFSVRSSNTVVDAHVAHGGDAVLVHDGRVLLHLFREWHDLGAVVHMPHTRSGTATYNIANIAGASVLAAVMGVPIDAIRATLRDFGRTPADNPGRLQLTQLGGVTVLMDYAHNPDGLAALCRAASSIAAKRRLLILGQAGNRDDAQLCALVRAAWDVTPFDHIIIKELPTMLRGRPLGEVPRVLAAELLRLGVAQSRIDTAPSEFKAVTRALSWAQDGDVLVCPVHVEKAAVLALLAHLHDVGWQPGRPIPGL